MRVIVAGGGRVGVELAAVLAAAGHEVVVVEVDPVRADDLARRATPGRDGAPGGGGGGSDGGEGGGGDLVAAPGSVRVVTGSACVVEVLEEAGALSADAVVACTGDDAENLVVAALASRLLDVPQVVARCNHEENRWLFDEAWGVGAAVSFASTLAAALAPGVRR